jgi:hypothetical protein
VSDSPRWDVTEGLRTMLASVTGKGVGVMKAPDAPAGAVCPVMPYAIVYPIPGGGFGGSMADPYEDVTYVYQVTSVGETPTQCQAMGDAVRKAILNAANPIALTATLAPSRKVSRREPDGAPGGIDVGAPDLYYLPERYKLTISQA